MLPLRHHLEPSHAGAALWRCLPLGCACSRSCLAHHLASSLTYCTLSTLLPRSSVPHHIIVYASRESDCVLFLHSACTFIPCTRLTFIRHTSRVDPSRLCISCLRAFWVFCASPCCPSTMTRSSRSARFPVYFFLGVSLAELIVTSLLCCIY